MSVMSLAKAALKNLRSRPATRNYPQQQHEYFERTRGHIEWDESCILCGLCERKCPTGAIRVDKPDRKWSIDRFGCIQCGSCVECCPKHSLHMRAAYTVPAQQKRVDDEHLNA